MKRFTRSSRSFASLLALTVALSVSIWACSGDNDSVTSPQVNNNTFRTFGADPGMMGALEVQNRNSSKLFAVKGVVGHMITADDAGKPLMIVMTETAIPDSDLPSSIEGIRVEQRVTGKFKARKGPGGGGGGKKGLKMGVSGGWRYDLANGFCCGGTLGCLVESGGVKYILSNYHVLEGDIVNGGNGRTADAGDPVINPGLIDVQCNANQATDVAFLEGTHSLPGSNVDAAIAEIPASNPGNVDLTGAIDRIGQPSTTIIPLGSLSVGQGVKKMGRTSGLTRSTFAGIGSASVQYEDECAGSPAFTKTFNNQIFVNQGFPGFLQGGDSGSLMVEDVKRNPRPIGLCFAGSSQYAVANPIADVLNFFGVSIVGK